MSGPTPIHDSVDYMRKVAQSRGFPFCEKHGVMYDEEGCIFCNDDDPGLNEKAAYIKECVALQPATEQSKQAEN